MPGHRKKTDTHVAIGMEITSNRATFGLVDQYGKILHRFNVKTLRGRPATATLEPYLRTLEQALSSAKSEHLQVAGLGISIPGSLDLTGRMPHIIPALPSLNKFPLCDLLEARHNLPVQLHVDVDASLLSEYHFGAGQDFQRLLFLNVDTVVGAAVFRDGNLERSEKAYVGHVCHLAISMNSPRCSCGKYGCINTLISLEAMQKMVKRVLRRSEQTNLVRRLSNREHFSHQLLAEEALQGDSIAIHVYCEVGRRISAAAAKYMDIFQPEVLILGGEALCAKELLIANVRNSLMLRLPAKDVNTLEIVPSHLGSDATLIGAASSFFQKGS